MGEFFNTLNKFNATGFCKQIVNWWALQLCVFFIFTQIERTREGRLKSARGRLKSAGRNSTVVNETEQTIFSFIQSPPYHANIVKYCLCLSWTS